MNSAHLKFLLGCVASLQDDVLSRNHSGQQILSLHGQAEVVCSGGEGLLISHE